MAIAWTMLALQEAEDTNAEREGRERRQIEVRSKMCLGVAFSFFLIILHMAMSLVACVDVCPFTRKIESLDSACLEFLKVFLHTPAFGVTLRDRTV